MARRGDKDTAMDGLLRRSFAAGVRGDVTEECPSAEALAAYYDGTSDKAQHARYELHFSQCVRCRQQLVALVRADESADAAAAKRAGAWSWFTHQWWLVPVAGTLVIAAFVYIGFMPRFRRLASRPGSEMALSKKEPATDTGVAPPPVPKTAPAAVPLASDLARLKAETKQALQDKVEAKKNAPAAGAKSATATARTGTATGVGRASNAVQSSGSGAGVAGRLAGDAPANAAPSAKARPQIPSQTEAVEVTSEAPALASAAPAAPAPAPPPEMQETNSDVNKQDAKDAQELPRSRTAAGGVGRPTSRVLAQTEEGNAVAKSKPGGQKVAVASAPVAAALTKARSDTKVITSPDLQSQWRIAEGGFVEHTENGGSTWTGVEPAPDARLTAGSAPAARTCWFVGRNGMILVTTDAVHWKIVPPPIQADFADVTAINGREAIVTTADSRKFSTRNAGKSWRQVP